MKKYQKPAKNKASTPTKPKENISSFNLQDYIYLIFIALYLLVDLTPKGDVIDFTGQHRVLIDIINIGASIYIFRNMSKFDFKFNLFFRQIIPILFGIFYLVSAASIFVGLNKIEGLVTIFWHTTTFLAFANIFALIYLGKNNIKAIAAIVTGIVFIQASTELYNFYKTIDTKPIYEIILNIKWNTGNKNIFAATLAVKLCFVIYTFFRQKGFWKYLGIITMFITMLLLILLSARTVYLSLSIMILWVTISVVILFWKTTERKTTLIHASVIFASLIASFIFANNTLTKYAYSDNNAETKESYIGKRAATITNLNENSTNIRLNYWRESLKEISERPLSGWGLGNYKIESPRMVSKYHKSAVFNRYNHNDFLEITFESGIFAGLAYLGIFIFALIYTLKILIDKRYNKERKFVAIILFSGVIAYFFDSVFNFPLTRANLNISFVLILSLIISNYISVRINDEQLKPSNQYGKYIYIALFILGLGGTYMNYNLYNSYRAQYVIDADTQNVDYSKPKTKFNHDQVNKMLSGSISNIGADEEPLILKEVKYLFYEKRYDEALDLLKDYDKISPHTVYDDNLKVLIFASLNKQDSAYHYSQIMFAQRPYSYNDYKMNVELAGKNNDVAGIKKSFDAYNNYHQTEEAYEYYIKNLLRAKYDFLSDMSPIEEGLKLYPESKTLTSAKQYYELMRLQKEGKITFINSAK